MSLETARCRHHRHREAVARCPDCGAYLCRECVTEVEGRFLCAECFDAQAAVGRRQSSLPALLVGLALALTGLVFLWGVFFYLGKSLLWLPSEFHLGTFWKSL